MKKLLCAIVLASASLVVLAANTNVTSTVSKRERFLQKTGGLVAKPGTQTGEIFYVNCQKRGSTESIKASIAYFSKELHFKITLKENGAFSFPKPKVEGNATLFIVDDANLPVLLAAPEDRWALVNVAPISEEKRPAFFEARFRKELQRGFAYLCGAANSQYPMSLTRGIVSRADLDQNPDIWLPIDILGRMTTYMAPLGVTPAEIATYRTACRAGWAPAPTNDYQKAIWNKVRELPKTPLKLEK